MCRGWALGTAPSHCPRFPQLCWVCPGSRARAGTGHIVRQSWGGAAEPWPGAASCPDVTATSTLRCWWGQVCQLSDTVRPAWGPRQPGTLLVEQRVQRVREVSDTVTQAGACQVKGRLALPMGQVPLGARLQPRQPHAFGQQRCAALGPPWPRSPCSEAVRVSHAC